MKYSFQIWILAALMPLIVSDRLNAQVLWNGSGQYRLDPANPPADFTIGNAFSSGSALNVRGDLMGVPTGEVFRTDAPNGANTSWRLLRGGTNYGHLFSLSTDVHLRLDASAGDLRFLTLGLERGRFNETLTNETINTYGPLDLSGNFGVGTFTNAYPHPAARVHTDRTSAFDYGFRDVMRDGFLATQGERLYYGGLIDGYDAGILWAHYTVPTGTPGAFKFIYTGDKQVSGVQASLTSGLELGRFEPDANLNEGYFGVGDWASASATPDERLDILNRTVKIRRLIPDYNDNSLTNVVVADANGKLHWRDANN